MTDETQSNENLDPEIENLEPMENQEDVEQVNMTEEPEVEEVKQKAKSTGHLSKEDYLKKYGNLKGYKTEDEFVRTGDMIEQIYALKKKLDERDTEINAILNYTKNTISEHKTKVRQELETKLAQAREYGNIEAVEALVKQQTQLDFQDQQDQLKNQLSAQQQAVNVFLERNKHWYNEQHPEAVARANQIDQEISGYYKRIGQQISYDQLALEVETQMKREFPDLVNTGIKVRPTISATKSTVNKATATFEESDDKVYQKLSQDEKLMYQAQKRMLTKAGYSYTIKDFVKKLKEDGEI